MTYTIDVYRRQHRAARDLARLRALRLLLPAARGRTDRARRRNLLPQVQRPRRVTRDDLQRGHDAHHLGPVQEGLRGRQPGAPWSTRSTRRARARRPRGADRDLSPSPSRSTATSPATPTSRAAPARMLGFELMQNFQIPYFARDHGEFWRRWHISLSTWLRDYLYIPLGGNRGSEPRIAFNLFLTMFLGGPVARLARHLPRLRRLHGHRAGALASLPPALPGARGPGALAGRDHLGLPVHDRHRLLPRPDDAAVPALLRAPVERPPLGPGRARHARAAGLLRRARCSPSTSCTGTTRPTPSCCAGPSRRASRPACWR